MVPEAETACGAAIDVALQWDASSAEALQIAASYNISCKRLDDALALLRRSHALWRDLIARAHKFDNDDYDEDDEDGDNNNNNNNNKTSKNNNKNNNNNDDDDGDDDVLDRAGALSESELLAIPSFEHRMETARLFMELRDASCKRLETVFCCC